MVDEVGVLDVAVAAALLGVLCIKFLWKMCFFIESPIDFADLPGFSRFKTCNGVPG